MEIVRKPVAFNLTDPDQAKMLEHAGKRQNFSGYIKRLIQRDMEGLRDLPWESSGQNYDAGLMQGLL